jgi:hypothetical protein
MNPSLGSRTLGQLFAHSHASSSNTSSLNSYVPTEMSRLHSVSARLLPTFKATMSPICRLTIPPACSLRASALSHLE